MLQPSILTFSHKFIILSELQQINNEIMSSEKKGYLQLFRVATRQQKPSFVIKRSHSILLQNRLTKPYFSLRDTSLPSANLHKLTKIDKAEKQKQVNIKGASSKFLQRYHSQQTEPTNYHNITQAFIPKISLRRKEVEPSIKRTKSVQVVNNSNLKFKLLFREQKQIKTATDRKIQRLGKKIADLEIHNKKLLKLKPQPPVKIIEEKVKPRGTIVDLFKIQKMTKTLIRNVNLYFSMYSDPKRVGDLLKCIEGYHRFLHKIFFENQDDAKIIFEDDVTKYFWIAQPQETRPLFYGEEDLYLFNLLQNFSLKMQKSYSQIRKNFIVKESEKMESIKKTISKKLTINQKKLDVNSYKSNKQIFDITTLLDKRVRHNQDRREEMLSKLQQFGVRFNVQQRSKQLIMTEKEKIMRGQLFQNLFRN